MFRETCQRVRLPMDVAVASQPRVPQQIAAFLAEVRSDALRVGPTTSPTIWRTVERVSESLGLEVLPEVYVKAHPEINAYVPSVTDHERPLVVLHSGLVSLLSPAELGFVIGHELGHLGLGHTHRMFTPPTNELDALRERAAGRARELSCDRVGLLAVGSTYVAAGQMIKSASGLSSEFLGFDADAFIAQLDGDLPDDLMARDSHPTLPFRLWALLRFSRSDVYLELSGLGGRGIPLVEVDAEIEARLASLGEGRLTRIEDELLEAALTWAAMIIVLADDLVEDGERAALATLLGEDRGARAIRYAEQFGGEAVRTKFDEAFAEVVGAGEPVRLRFTESLTSFAFDLGLDPADAARLLGAEL